MGREWHLPEKGRVYLVLRLHFTAVARWYALVHLQNSLSTIPCLILRPLNW
jgi:hypothetical protein